MILCVCVCVPMSILSYKFGGFPYYDLVCFPMFSYVYTFLWMCMFSYVFLYVPMILYAFFPRWDQVCRVTMLSPPASCQKILAASMVCLGSWYTMGMQIDAPRGILCFSMLTYDVLCFPMLSYGSLFFPMILYVFLCFPVLFFRFL